MNLPQISISVHVRSQRSFKEVKNTWKMAVWSNRKDSKLADPKLDRRASYKPFLAMHQMMSAYIVSTKLCSTEGPSSWICLQAFWTSSLPPPLGDTGYSSVFNISDRVVRRPFLGLIKALCERTRELNRWMKYFGLCLKVFPSLIFIPRIWTTVVR